MRPSFRAMSLLSATALLVALAAPGTAEGPAPTTSPRLAPPDDNIDRWVGAVSSVCDPIAFCQVCVATCIGTCLSKGGQQALATCRITATDCTCICECKKVEIVLY